MSSTTSDRDENAAVGYLSTQNLGDSGASTDELVSPDEPTIERSTSPRDAATQPPQRAAALDVDAATLRMPETATAAATGDPAAVSYVGRFAILRELGRGGMGQVFVAYDETLDRKVAVKLLHAGTFDTKANQRLLREARAMAKIAHPNVAAIHEVGELDTRIFVAMELIPGLTLREWCAAEERDWRDTLAMFLQAGRGLAAAHHAGIIHRDFKPENVLVGKDLRARVLDFGLARMLEVGDGESDATDGGDAYAAGRGSGHGRTSLPQLTQAGAIMGTPLYMSPEQYGGQSAGARSDQYNFCVALYEALYRISPFVADSMENHVNAKRSTEITRPGRLSPQLAPVYELLVRGLAADPDERWPTMDALLEQLQVILDRAADTSRRFSRAERVILFGVFGPLSMFVPVFIVLTFGDINKIEPRETINGAMSILVVVLVSIVCVWRFVPRRTRSKIMPILYLALITVAALALRRLLSVDESTQISDIFVQDLMLVATAAAVGGMAIHRLLWGLAIAAGAFAYLATRMPEYAGYFMLSVPAGLPLLGFLLWLKGRAARGTAAIRTMISRSRA